MARFQVLTVTILRNAVWQTLTDGSQKFTASISTALMMEVVSSFETSVKSTTLKNVNIPEHSRIQY
jgi:hypothetical protein